MKSALVLLCISHHLYVCCVLNIAQNNLSDILNILNDYVFCLSDAVLIY